MKKYTSFIFRISLSILEQLGRGLYRNFITVIGEAISNSWDADAQNIWIETKKNGKDGFVIKDDGVGMTAKDFSEKFLDIGYSKRKKGQSTKSNKGRPFIGRKGIGKLALLSCADKISILTKAKGHDYIGGVIIDKELDVAIQNSVDPNDYRLKKIEKSIFTKYTRGHTHGTIIHFDGLKGKTISNDDSLRKSIALNFRFSLLDKDFHIYLNNKEITIDDLKELRSNTQFLWEINQLKNDDFFDELKKTVKQSGNKEIPNLSVKGFIASVNVPKNLNVFGTGEKIGVDFYVNGRFRESNLLRGTISTQHVASYLYGQIHYDEIDAKEIDPFTTNREGVRQENKDYQDFTKALQLVLFDIANEWDELRRKHKQDGDPDNKSMPKHQRKIEESKNSRARDFEKKIDETSLAPETKKRLKDKLREQSSSNTLIYQDLFILENLFREYIKTENLESFSSIQERFSGGDLNKINECIRIAKKHKKGNAEDEARHALGGRIKKNDCDINYLDLICLGAILDMLKETHWRRQHLEDDAKEISPIRNAVMHTNEITTDVMDWEKIKKIIDLLDKIIKQD